MPFQSRIEAPRMCLLGAVLTLALSAHAQSRSEQAQSQPSQATPPQSTQAQQREARDQRAVQRGSAGDLERWSQMESEVVRGRDLLDGDVSDGLNRLGSIADLVLSEDGRRVEFILYEVPYRFSLYGNKDGFTAFEDVDIFRAAGVDIEVRLPIEADQAGPEELQLTAEEAERRLASRIIGQRMYFSPEESRRIEDMLIDRETGEVVHYVIETDPNAIFRADRRTVPAEQVTIGDQGEISAAIELAGLDDVQQYDSELL